MDYLLLQINFCETAHIICKLFDLKQIRFFSYARMMAT